MIHMTEKLLLSTTYMQAIENKKSAQQRTDWEYLNKREKIDFFPFRKQQFTDYRFTMNTEQNKKNIIITEQQYRWLTCKGTGLMLEN